jgi:hypothetical protein
MYCSGSCHTRYNFRLRCELRLGVEVRHPSMHSRRIDLMMLTDGRSAELGNHCRTSCSVAQLGQCVQALAQAKLVSQMHRQQVSKQRDTQR